MESLGVMGVSMQTLNLMQTSFKSSELRSEISQVETKTNSPPQLLSNLSASRCLVPCEPTTSRLITSLTDGAYSETLVKTTNGCVVAPILDGIRVPIELQGCSVLLFAWR